MDSPEGIRDSPEGIPLKNSPEGIEERNVVAKKQPRGHHYGSTIPRDLETYLRAQTSYRLTRGQKSTL